MASTLQNSRPPAAPILSSLMCYATAATAAIISPMSLSKHNVIIFMWRQEIALALAILLLFFWAGLLLLHAPQAHLLWATGSSKHTTTQKEPAGYRRLEEPPSTVHQKCSATSLSLHLN